MSKKITTVGKIVKDFPKLWDYNYKWQDTEEFRRLEDVLEIIGYRIYDPDDDYVRMEYNDLKGYLGQPIIKIS